MASEKSFAAFVKKKAEHQNVSGAASGASSGVATGVGSGASSAIGSGPVSGTGFGSTSASAGLVKRHSPSLLSFPNEPRLGSVEKTKGKANQHLKEIKSGNEGKIAACFFFFLFFLFWIWALSNSSRIGVFAVLFFSFASSFSPFFSSCLLSFFCLVHLFALLSLLLVPLPLFLILILIFLLIFFLLMLLFLFFLFLLFFFLFLISKSPPPLHHRFRSPMGLLAIDGSVLFCAGNSVFHLDPTF